MDFLLQTSAQAPDFLTDIIGGLLPDKKLGYDRFHPPDFDQSYRLTLYRVFQEE